MRNSRVKNEPHECSQPPLLQLQARWPQNYPDPRGFSPRERSGEKEKLLITLDLNLTFLQTPGVKLVKFLITKGTNGNSVITCLSATNFFLNGVAPGNFSYDNPQWSWRFCRDKHYYGACSSTSRCVRRTRDFRIQRNKFLWANCSHRRLHRSNWLLKCHGFADSKDESPPDTSEDTQPKLWHDEGMNSLTGTGICRH